MIILVTIFLYTMTALNMPEYWFSLIQESKSLSLYGKIRVRENQYSGIFYGVDLNTRIYRFLRKKTKIIIQWEYFAKIQ